MDLIFLGESLRELDLVATLITLPLRRSAHIPDLGRMRDGI
ncbi:hypothetical protein [Nonomuraea sp. B19D2]